MWMSDVYRKTIAACSKHAQTRSAADLTVSGRDRAQQFQIENGDGAVGKFDGTGLLQIAEDAARRFS
jgi:hypothetical protein